jgi:glutamyl-Q tRNA(Asp) synthetase
VVVDDAEQKVTHIVRGADLLNSSTRQIHLQQCLNYPPIQYAHIPVVANPQGEKLSKQTLAKAIDSDNPAQTLWLALDFLQQQPPQRLKNASINAIWSWAIEHWCLHKITGNTKLIHNKKFI